MAVWVAGLAAAGASALLAILVGLAVLQLAMASSAKRVVISYSAALIGKVALATLASEYTIFPYNCVIYNKYTAEPRAEQERDSMSGTTAWPVTEKRMAFYFNLISHGLS